jgi:hypothetical protein
MVTDYQKGVQKVPLMIMVMMVLTLAGCGSVGRVVGGPDQTYNETFTMSLPSARPDVLDIISEVGESLGYKVASRNKGIGFIRLSSQGSLAALMLVGKLNTSALDIRIVGGGTELQITVHITGNFGAAGSEQAAKLMEDFKIKLLERIEKT